MSQRTRWTMQLTLPAIGIMAFVTALWFTGCATTIIPPEKPSSPRAIVLLDHGRHASLALARPDGDLLRFSYGEWNWYALGKETVGGAFAALCVPTEAALGRSELKGPPTVGSINRQLRFNVEEAFVFDAESEAVDNLIMMLEALFDANRDTLIYNDTYNVEFVRHPTPYTLNHNSNRVVAYWLESLGFEIRGAALYSSWRVAERR